MITAENIINVGFILLYLIGIIIILAIISIGFDFVVEKLEIWYYKRKEIKCKRNL